MKKIELAVLLLSPALTLFSLFAPYFLNPYIAVAVMFLSAASLFFLSNKISQNTLPKIIGYSFGFACLVLIAGVPSGELGMAECPDSVENPSASVKIFYFYSPFCPKCHQQESELKSLVSEIGDVGIYKYDIRYCRKEAEARGFSGTPCISITAGGQSLSACGIVQKGELLEMVRELRASEGRPA